MTGTPAGHRRLGAYRRPELIISGQRPSCTALATSARASARLAACRAASAIIWHILATATPCTDLGADYFTHRQDPDRETRRLIAKLQALGHTVSLQPAA